MAEAIKGLLGGLGKGKDKNHDVQVLNIPIPTKIILKYLPDMLNDLKEGLTE